MAYMRLGSKGLHNRYRPPMLKCQNYSGNKHVYSLVQTDTTTCDKSDSHIKIKYLNNSYGKMLKVIHSKECGQFELQMGVTHAVSLNITCLAHFHYA